MRRDFRPVLAGLLIAVAAPAAAQDPRQHLRLVAPAAPGGGWDQTARAMQQALQQAGIAQTVPVENIPGAAGLIGLARFVGSEQGSSDTLMVSGLIMLGAIVTQRSAITLQDVTSIARLTGEYEVLAVPAASPIRSLDELIRAFKERPEAVSWGGGSAGGSDQILAGLIADAVGVAPRRVNYIAFSGGGESLAAILGGEVTVGINGLAEFAPQIEAGTIRPLAISSAERLPGLDVPTLREQGIDLEFENWRSVVAPPGLNAAERRQLEGVVDAMVRSSAWREALTRYRWIDRYLAGAEFERFVDTEHARVQRIIQQLGTGAEEATGPPGKYPLFVLGGLLLFGVVAVVPAIRARPRETGPPTARGWRSVGLVAAGGVLDVLFAERLGFIIASAVLFWLVARAFDERRPIRDALFAVAISVGAYLLFGRVLDLPLPAGVLAF